MLFSFINTFPTAVPCPDSLSRRSINSARTMSSSLSLSASLSDMSSSACSSFCFPFWCLVKSLRTFSIRSLLQQNIILFGFVCACIVTLRFGSSRFTSSERYIIFSVHSICIWISCQRSTLHKRSVYSENLRFTD